MHNFKEIKELLDYKCQVYNCEQFIEGDPISIPHHFRRKEDIEISAFLTATIAWGRRKSIVENAWALMNAIGFSPYEFITQAGEQDLKAVGTFRHRTFNGLDCLYFIRSLRVIYLEKGGLEKAFGLDNNLNMRDSLIGFRNSFFSLEHPERTLKHISDPGKGSPAKRMNMFLRWMGRKDNRGVDFGIWHSAKPSQLYCPLDVHTGNVARKLGLITRKQNDWIALEELMAHLRQFDPEDPVKYDFALFGLGIFEKF